MPSYGSIVIENKMQFARKEVSKVQMARGIMETGSHRSRRDTYLAVRKQQKLPHANIY